jgi:PE family
MTTVMTHELKASGCDQPAERLLRARQRGALATESQEGKGGRADEQQLSGNNGWHRLRRCHALQLIESAAAGQVSALTAAQSAAHAQMYQAVNAAAAAIHELLFVNTSGMSSGSYTATEAANVVAAN